MDSEAYLHRAGLLRTVNASLDRELARDSDPERLDRLMQLGAEAVIAATLARDSELVTTLADSFRIVARSEISIFNRLTPKQRNSLQAMTFAKESSVDRIVQSLRAQAPIREEAMKFMDDSRRDIRRTQGELFASFMSNRLQNPGQGEDTRSFNKRLLKTATLSELGLRLLPITRCGNSEPYSFQVAGETFSDLGNSDHGCLVNVHALQTEYDALVALQFIAAKYDFGFIPLLATPNIDRIRNSHQKSPRLNADILLVKDDGTETLPVQIKVDWHEPKNGARQKEPPYDEEVLIIDSKTLGTWSYENTTTKTKSGKTRTKPHVQFLAGGITAAFARRQAKRAPLPKSLQTITKNSQTEQSIVEALRSKGFAA